jgi:GNAT superfamily N-acetyltransferase
VTVREPDDETVVILPARGAADLAAARALLYEYYRLPDAWDGTAPAIEQLPEVLRNEAQCLPGRYSPPKGDVLLAGTKADGHLGVAVFAPSTSSGACGLKRLYVRPQGRGRGIGRRLVDACLAAAREASYQSVELDVLPTRAAAIALYQSFGFGGVPPPEDNPHRLVFMRLDL